MKFQKKCKDGEEKINKERDVRRRKEWSERREIMREIK
jgi:hypothetical protein